MTPRGSIGSQLSARNRHIDFLRGISILLVILGHLGYIGGGSGPFFIGSGLYNALSVNNYLGVTVFFVISGYVITETSLRRYGSFGAVRIGHFYVYRASRILPPLLLLVALNLTFYYVGWPGFDFPPAAQVTMGKLLLYVFTFRFNILYLTGGAALVAWAPLWSLAVEEVFYLCFPIASRILRSKVLMVALFCVVAVQGAFFRNVDGWGSLYRYRGCIDSLAIGCLAAIATAGSTLLVRRRQLARLFRWVGLIVVFVAWTYTDLHNGLARVWMPLVVSLGAALFLFGTSGHRSEADEPAPSVLYRGVCVAGLLSYELYIFHLPILLLLKKPELWLTRAGQLRWQPADANLVVIVAAMCLVCSGISLYYCEPVLRAIRARLSPGRPAAGQRQS